MTPKNKNNNISKMAIARILIVLFCGFLAYTALKIYVTDPQIYAEKKELVKIEDEIKKGLNSTFSLATQNKETIIMIQGSLKAIEKNQEEVKIQANQSQTNQTEILKILREIKRDRDR